MSQKSFLDNKKSRKNFPYVGRGRGGSTNIWKIPYVSSFLFLKASLRHTTIVGIKVFDQNIDFRKPNAKFCYLQKYVKSVKTTPKFLAAKELFYLFIYSNIFLTLVSSGKTGN